MENLIEIGMNIWMLSYAIFKMNPVNDPLNPLSTMNQFHHENLAGKEKLRKLLEEEGGNVKEPVIFWNDVWPILHPSIMTVLALVVICLTRYKVEKITAVKKKLAKWLKTDQTVTSGNRELRF